MPLHETWSLVGSFLFALGGGAGIVFALSKYLGGIWASRILEKERGAITREQELLVRRRNIYAKLSQTLRVFLTATVPATLEEQRAFLAAYDEAALWATEEVVEAVAELVDMYATNSAVPGSVSMDAQIAAYVRCITAMRRDSGFPSTEYAHRLVSF